jgi:hypothetical protein
MKLKKDIDYRGSFDCQSKDISLSCSFNSKDPDDDLKREGI